MAEWNILAYLHEISLHVTQRGPRKQGSAIQQPSRSTYYNFKYLTYFMAPSTLAMTVTVQFQPASASGITTEQSRAPPFVLNTYQRASNHDCYRVLSAVRPSQDPFHCRQTMVRCSCHLTTSWWMAYGGPSQHSSNDCRVDSDDHILRGGSCRSQGFQ